jgi:hypothetical protein
MYEGYFLEIEKHLAAAKLAVYFLETEFGGEEEKEEVLENLDRARIALRDLIEEVKNV